MSGCKKKVVLSNNIAKKDKALAIRFIEDTTNNKYNGNLWKYLKDGVVLCELMNKVIKDSITKINKPGVEFKEIQNIMSYLNICKKILDRDYIFSPMELYNKNINYSDKIYKNIIALRDFYLKNQNTHGIEKTSSRTC